MPLSKRTEEEFDKLTALTLEDGTRIGRIINYYDLILSFIHQSQVDAIKEFVEGLLPEKCNDDTGIGYGHPTTDYKTGRNQAIDEIQERINEKLCSLSIKK